MTHNLNNLTINSFDDFCQFLYFIDESYITNEERLIQLQNYSQEKFSFDLDEALSIAEDKLNNILSDETIYQAIETSFELNYPQFFDQLAKRFSTSQSIDRQIFLEISALGLRNIYNYLSCKESEFLAIDSFFSLIDAYLRSDLYLDLIYHSYLFYEVVRRTNIDDFSYYLRFLSLAPTHAYRYFIDKKHNTNPNFELKEMLFYYEMFSKRKMNLYKSIVIEMMNNFLNDYQKVYFQNFARLINAYHSYLEGFKLSKLNYLEEDDFNKFVDKFISDSETSDLAYDEFDYHKSVLITSYNKQFLIDSDDKNKYYYSKIIHLKQLIKDYRKTYLYDFAEQYIFIEDPNIVNVTIFEDLCACLRDETFYSCSAADNLAMVSTKVLESKLNSSIIINRNNIFNQQIKNYEFDVILSDFFVFMANFILNNNQDFNLESLNAKNHVNYRKQIIKKYFKKNKLHSPIYYQILENNPKREEILKISANLMIMNPAKIRVDLKHQDILADVEFESNLIMDVKIHYDYLNNQLYTNLNNENLEKAIKSLLLFFANESDVAISSAAIFDIYLNELYASIGLN